MCGRVRGIERVCGIVLVAFELPARGDDARVCVMGAFRWESGRGREAEEEQMRSDPSTKSGAPVDEGRKTREKD